MITPLIETLLILPVAAGLVFLLFRFYRGPANLDRLVTFEGIALLMVCFFAFLGMHYQTEWFFDAVLVLSLIGFLSTTALALQISRQIGEI